MSIAQPQPNSPFQTEDFLFLKKLIWTLVVEKLQNTMTLVVKVDRVTDLGLSAAGGLETLATNKWTVQANVQVPLGGHRL